MSFIDVILIGALFFLGYWMVSKLMAKKPQSPPFKESENIEPARAVAREIHEKYFRCPSCTQRIRVKMPAPFDVVICTNCECRLRLAFNDDDTISPIIIDSGKNYSRQNESVSIRTREECWHVLGLEQNPTPEEIKVAYRKRISQYHPDKVGHLGDKLREIAEFETKKINAAYAFLQINR